MPKIILDIFSEKLLIGLVTEIGLYNRERDVLFYYHGLDPIQIGARQTALNVWVRKLNLVRELIPLPKDAVVVVGLGELLVDEDWLDIGLRDTDFLLKLQSRPAVDKIFQPLFKPF